MRRRPCSTKNILANLFAFSAIKQYKSGKEDFMQLIAKNIVKDYPGCRALDDVSIALHSGRVYGLIGKNGSGKSTLVKLFAGVIRPTAGELYMDDQKLLFRDPNDAHEKGIVTVYQEMSLVPGLSVAENIFLNRMPKKNSRINWRAAYKEAKDLLKTMGVEIDPREPVSTLSMWQRQIVEITKAMSFHPKVLLLDEPTSALAQNEVRNLLEFVKSLKDRDIVIIYITHKLQELHIVADEVAVLRDGHFIGKASMDEIDHKGIVNMMFGEVSIRSRPKDIAVRAETVLRVNHLSRPPHYNDVSFALRKGEVLGIAGMLGAGRTELLRGIFGADPFSAGSIELNGHVLTRTNPAKMIAQGIGLTPEDRKNEGLIAIHSIKDNLCYASMRQTVIGGILEDKPKRSRLAEKQVKELQILIPGMDAPCSSLSGGNQQKVVVGNWLNTQPEIMFYDEPSRGIDVNAKQQIFEIMWAQARKGISTLFVSSELEELLEVCHRILIMKEGAVVGQVNPDVCTINELYSCCMSGVIPHSITFAESGAEDIGKE